MPAQKTLPTKLRVARLGPWPAGIDEKTAPYALSPKHCRAAQNVLMDEKPGAAVKRQGYRVISTLPSGLPARDTYKFTKANGNAYILASDGASLYYTTDPSLQLSWTLLKSGLTSTAFMEFETAEDKVWMTNRVDAPMSWDASTLIIFDRAFTSTTDATAISQTTVRHASLTGTTDFWKGMLIVWTSGANKGTYGIVSAYDPTNKELTFPQLANGVAVTDRFAVGLIIPSFAAFRYWDGHLWGFSTITNPSEGRFTALTDPNTGTGITIDHPLAWPAANQLSFQESDGDRVWGVSPVLRDRILVMKATGIFRIERDPLTTYAFASISKAVGSRFSRSWAEKSGILYFFGQEPDGLPNVYATDTVDVKAVDELGRLEPTLRQLRQPNSVQRSRSFASKSDWDAGTKSRLVNTDASRMALGGFDTQADFIAALVSAQNIDIETNPGSISVQGYPVWSKAYPAAVLPASDGWTRTFSSNSSPAATISESANGEYSAEIASIGLTRDDFVKNYRTLDAAVGSKDILTRLRTKWSAYPNGLYDTNNNIYGFHSVRNGTYQADLTWTKTKLFINGTQYAVDFTVYHEIAVLLKSGGAIKVWVDGLLKHSGTGSSHASKEVAFGLRVQDANPSSGHVLLYDYVNYHENFRGDNLSSQGGKVTVASMPDTLPTSGNIVLLNDQNRAPDALRRIYANYGANGGTLTIESWTASAQDFGSGTDPAGYVSVSNGAAPTSQVLRYQRLRLTLGAVIDGLSPEVAALYAGAIYLTPPILVGANIASWRTYQDTTTVPAGTELTKKVRSTAVTGVPAESDWGPWLNLTTGDNIGTDLADGTPPTSRQAQVKYELGPSSSGLLPSVQSASLEWNEGSNANLPLQAVVHKRRYLAAAANATAAYNDIVVVLDRNDAWMKFVGWNVNGMLQFQGRLIGFDSSGPNILELDYAGSYSDGGAAIDASVTTREEILDDQDTRKDLRYSDVHVGDPLGALDVSFKRPSDAAFSAAKTLTLEGRGISKRVTFPAATVTKRFQRRYRNAVPDAQMELRGETLYYVERAA